MKLFLSTLATDLKRSCLTLRFLICSVGVCAVLFIAASGQIRHAPDVLYLLGLAVGGSGSVNVFIAILPIFPYAISFASEWEGHASGFMMIRSGVNRYTLSKYVSAGVSGLLTTAAGMALFVLVLCLRFPLFVHSSTGGPYEPLLLSGLPVAYTIYFITHYSLSAALMALVAFGMSTLVPNRFTTVAAPLVIYFLLHRIVSQIGLPAYLQPVNWVEGIYPAGSPALTLLAKGLTVGVLFLLIGYMSLRRVRKLVQND